MNTVAQPCAICNTKTQFRFKLLEKEGLHIDTSVVKIKGVYLLESYNENINMGKKTYNFCRFFSNGRVYISCSYCSFPTNSELNDLNFGRYGYYIVNGSNIKIETFEPYPRYYFVYCVMEGNILVSNGTSKRKWKKNVKKDPYAITVKYEYFKCNLTSSSFW